MQDDVLKQLWQRQTLDLPRQPDADLLKRAKQKAKQFDRTIFWRNVRENAAAVFVIVAFGHTLFTDPGLMAKVGSLLTILAAIFVIAYPIWRKRSVSRTKAEFSMIQSLETDLRNVNVEIALLRSIYWWYILPLTVGVLIYFFGTETSAVVRTFILVCIVLIDGFVYAINQYAVRKRLLPLKSEIESALSFAGAPSHTD